MIRGFSRRVPSTRFRTRDRSRNRIRIRSSNRNRNRIRIRNRIRHQDTQERALSGACHGHGIVPARPPGGASPMHNADAGQPTGRAMNSGFSGSDGGRRRASSAVAALSRYPPSDRTAHVTLGRRRRTRRPVMKRRTNPDAVESISSGSDTVPATATATGTGTGTDSCIQQNPVAQCAPGLRQ